MMKAVQITEFGGPEVLHTVDVAEPHAGPGQIRVAVRAAGVNPIDWKIRSGMIDVPLPTVTGSDISGVVDELGDGVSDVAIGDEVFGFATGGAAGEYALSEHYTRKPANLSFEEAAGLPIPVETTVRVLDKLGVAAGQTLVINGASGGVGSAAVQLAVGRGATVIGTASPGNHGYLRSLGALPTEYGDGLAQRVRSLAPDGVDAAFDVAGHGALPALIELTGSTDKVITIADMSAADHGVEFSSGAGDRAYQALAQVAELISRGAFSLPVAKTYSLDEASSAHRESEAGHVRGKLVLTVKA